MKHDATVLVAGGPIFSKLDENGIQEDDGFSTGLNLGSLRFIADLAGSTDAGLFATVIRTDGRTGWGELYRLGKRGGWSKVGATLPDTYVHFGIGQWSEGRVLALEGRDRPILTQPAARFRLVAGPRTPLPQFAPAPVLPAADEDAERCKLWGTAQTAKRLLALPSGDVFAFGVSCQASAESVEHWEPGQSKSSLLAFPDSSGWRLADVLARSARDVTVLFNTATEPLLAHFDGANWTTESLGIGQNEVVDSDLAVDGTLFVVARQKDGPGALWWRAPGQTAFGKLDVPTRPAPENWDASSSGVTSVAASSKDDVWVVIGNGLFHSRPAPGGSRRIVWAEGQQFPGELHLPKPATPACSNTYVLLYAMTKSTPAGYDFPLTRKALAGHSELGEVRLAETEDNGRRFFGAFVKDYAQGQALARLVREKVKGSVPAVLCARPKVVREVKVRAD